MNISKILLLFLSLPKIIYVNFRYLPLFQAIKLPILVTYNTSIKINGTIKLATVKTGCFIAGFHKVPICNTNDETKLIVNGVLELKGNVRLGNGSKIRVASGGYLKLGLNFHISASSTINCYHKITIGDDCLFGWDVLLMDSDAHPIYDHNGVIINRDLPITIGNHVWIGARAVILKNTTLPDMCVVGCNSTVSGQSFFSSTIIAGNPAKSKKTISDWKELCDNFHKMS